MSFEGLESCRLCSCEKNLISMFSGKAHNMRNFIRKMIEELIHVKIEQCDPFPLVCFNCSIDVSNFYFFKLNALHKQTELEGFSSPVSKTKRLKLQGINLRDVDLPTMQETETVINWLESKRVRMESTKMLVQQDTQTFQINCDVAIQCKVMDTHFKECQTSIPMLEKSTTRCNEINSHSPSKVSVKSTSSQTRSQSKETKSSECVSCKKHNSNASLKKKSKNSYTQTKPRSSKSTNIADKYSQTEQIKLAKASFQNSVGTVVCTQDRCAQTDLLNLVNKRTQCHLSRSNGFKNGMLQTKTKVSSSESKNSFKIVKSPTFTDTRLSGFDNIVSTATQPEMSMDQYNSLNFSDGYLTSKDSYLLSPIRNSTFAKKEDLLKIEKEEETISLSEETVTNRPSLENNGLLSPRSLELLQVNYNKRDLVKICKLCDKTLYNKLEVAKHNKTHMQCNLCKRKFRSLKATQSHINECKVNDVGLSLFVNLVRIDQISKIREKYFRSFDATAD